MKIINLSLIISSIDKDVKQLEFSTTLRKQVSAKPKPMHTLRFNSVYVSKRSAYICSPKKHTWEMFLTALFVKSQSENNPKCLSTGE